MTGQILATAHWRALDRDGEDTCRLCHADHGWMLIGHARFRGTGGETALDYIVRCDEHWMTLGADVTGLQDGIEVNLRILRDGDDWTLHDELQPQVSGAQDIDLSFTPATNLMPLRRLMASDDKVLRLRAAWLRYPEGDLAPLDQRYRRTETDGAVDYAAVQTGFSTRIDIDPSGFATSYPNFWEGEVTHAD